MDFISDQVASGHRFRTLTSSMTENVNRHVSGVRCRAAEASIGRQKHDLVTCTSDS